MLENKYLLLDTNMLISIAKNGDSFVDFFNDLEKYNVKSIIDYAVKFEFLRGAKTESDSKHKEEYLDILLGENRAELVSTNEIFENAREISNIYARKDQKLTKQISFADCLIAAQMKKYNENGSGDRLFLATIDNNDFPLFVFDRIKIYTVDFGTEIINVGIYRFNKEKYEVLKNGFYGIKQIKKTEEAEVPF